MKKNYFILSVLCILFVNCTSKYQENGWYFITDSEKDAFNKNSIVTVADFEFLQFDTVANMNDITYFIIGKIKVDKIQTWKNATEKAIGKQIGFLYNGKIITSPQINERIENGSFSISSQELSKDRKKMFDIFEHLKKEMEKP